jgi:hypothetical protein
VGGEPAAGAGVAPDGVVAVMPSAGGAVIALSAAGAALSATGAVAAASAGAPVTALSVVVVVVVSVASGFLAQAATIRLVAASIAPVAKSEVRMRAEVIVLSLVV